MSFIFREELFICVKVLVSKLHSTDLTELPYASNANVDTLHVIQNIILNCVLCV